MAIKGSDSNNLQKYIHYFSGSYAVKNDKNGVPITFGRFKSEDIACAAATLLIKHDWNINDVKKDSLIKYDDEFWVFKVMNNKLIFDSKFDTYERAVEYHEINSRCNDFHNDIFKDSPKKNRNKERFVETEKEEEPVADAKYIFEKSGRYSLKRSNRKGNHVYGEFESFSVARAARKLALDNKWRLKDGTEILFFDGHYWVFEASENVLDYKGKSDSYDGAFEIIQPSSESEENRNPYLEFASKKLEKGKTKRKLILKEKRKPVNANRIWKPLNRHDKLKLRQYKFIIVKSTVRESKLRATIEFTIQDGEIECIVNDEEIEWDRRKHLKFKNFPESELIFDVLERNDWDINRINLSSSIYFFDNQFYKIRTFNDDMIIFNTFKSYESAEKSPIFYKAEVIRNVKPQDIDKVGRKYEMVKFKDGEMFKVTSLKSLEEIKAIRDILMSIDWNVRILKENDLFYLNGIYWELEYSNHMIRLIDKYGSVKFV